MKKYTVILLAALLLFSFSACKKGSNERTSASSEATEQSREYTSDEKTDSGKGGYGSNTSAVISPSEKNGSRSENSADESSETQSSENSSVSGSGAGSGSESSGSESGGSESGGSDVETPDLPYNSDGGKIVLPWV